MFESTFRRLTPDGLFQRAVEGLVSLGIPGYILLVVMAHPGWVGAAAITTALATLGGPWGMLAGIGVLGLMVLVSKALAAFGLNALALAVVRGLIAKGESKKSIRAAIERIPKWIISAVLRRKMCDVLDESVQDDSDVPEKK